MRVLWLSAIKFNVSSGTDIKKTNISGGWIQAMLLELSRSNSIDGINFVTVVKSKKKLTFQEGKIKYTQLPSKHGIFKYDKKLGTLLNKEILDFKPDIIDVQGIEFYLIKSLLSTNPKVPVVATIQGLTSEIYKHYFAGIPLVELIVNRTLRNNILFDGIIERKNKYKKRGQNEIDSLKKLKYIIGRTRWDYLNTVKHNSELKYFSCGRILRDDFYEFTWDINKIERHSIFITQAHYPIKGLHLLLEAVYILSKKYPGIKLYIAGKDIFDRSRLIKRIQFTDYRKYMMKLIAKYNIEKNIILTGYLKSNDLVYRLLASHVFVLPSTIENSSNALAEAQIIGIPSVAALVGGNESYIENNKTGFLYNCYEPTMLADKIEQIFTNDELAKKLSENSKKAAVKRHSKTKNSEELINIYSEIISN